ncbi:Lnb N-terminal periplasmic domain-containing protein [Paenirhodobacter populi]|uniref:Lnb N-terminal periplasmic domain-containing protein n=1 Tax=Paenirhodobacter populi TaxID=2306993 RepID=UPI000FE40063|nr:DUF4105 domain-containing protein [Sinirhodobacter populi]RWR09469.1 DUF4105 domain-containing protein [Sinirhodobacter populi]
MARMMRGLDRVLFTLIAAGGAVWAGLAMFVQLAPPLRWLGWAALAVALIAAVVLRRRSRMAGWLVLALAAGAVGLWYQTIQPRADRDWAADVAHGVTARVQGDTVTLSDIRDFRWSAPDRAEERWITRSYELSQLETVDMFTSVWSNPAIAHVLVSFGFAGGDHVVFSAEIRRERGEVFNELGGFFRQFELVLIVATERDIVRLRTNYRKEEVSLFPVSLTPDQRREMFMAYVGLAGRLEQRPEFYNTVTANCTTVVWRIARMVYPELPVGGGLVLSGYLPDYLNRLGLLGGQGSLAERRAAARIDARAQAATEADFSAAIRVP